MDYTNPHELVGDKQYVFWNEWQQGTPLTFELIDYFKAPVIVRGRGRYVVYYAISQGEIPDLGTKKGDEIILFIARNAYCYALNKLPSDIKTPCMKPVADGKNLLITIERVNAERIKIHSQEILEPTPEQLVEAERQYGILRREYCGGRTQ